MSTPLSTRQLLQRLVAFDTTSSNSNLAFADFVADYTRGAGVRVERFDAPDDAKTTLRITAGPTRTDRSGLMLSGHMDVVPAVEPEWTSDPFTATQLGTNVVGRGTCDMKGFLAAATNALVSQDPAVLRHPLVLLFTYDEEVGTLGSREFVNRCTDPTPLPRRTIIGEPTSLIPIRMHKGHLKLRVVIDGVAAHSGLPDLGANAIEPAARAVTALADLRAALRRERPPTAEHFPDVPFPALNVATIAGGSAINVIPDRCVIDVGVRTLPGMETDPIVERVDDAIRVALGGSGYTLSVTGNSPAMCLDHRADVLTGFEDDPHPTDHGAAFATDAGWLQQLGCECVVWGPGDMHNAHRPNEYLPLDELERCERHVASMIRRWCGP